MQHQKIEQIRLDQATRKQNRVVVLGRFPPDNGFAARRLTRLVHILTVSGYKIETISGQISSACMRHISFETRKRFEQALEAVDLKDAILVVDLGTLGFGKSGKRHWWARRNQDWRRIALLHRWVREAKQVVWLGEREQTRAPNLFGNVFIRLTPWIGSTAASVHGWGKAVAGIAKQIDPDISMPVFSFAEAEETVFRLIGEVDGPTLSPHRLLEAAGLLSEDDAQCHALLHLAEVLIRLSRWPFLQRLKSAESPPSADLTERLCHGDLYLQHLHGLSGSGLELVDWLLWEAPKSGVFLPVSDALSAKLQNRMDRSHPIEPDEFGTPHPGAQAFTSAAKLGRKPKTHLEAGLLALLFRARQTAEVDWTSQEFRDWVNEKPVGWELSRLELVMAALFRAPVETDEDIRQPWASERLHVWATEALPNLAPALHPPRPELVENFPSLKLSGVSERQSGLGRNLTMSEQAFVKIGISSKPEQQDAFSLTRPVVMHHVNADQVPQSMIKHHTWQAAHLGFLLWELEQLPPVHFAAGQLLDEIWAPTRFIADTLTRAYQREVQVMGKGINLPNPSELVRTDFGMDHSSFTFLCCFDGPSSAARKNPLATVRAFIDAFPRDADVRLIVKHTPVSRDHWGDPESQIRAIHRLARKDRRIHLMEDFLTFLDLLRLIELCDCVVSTHRAEGFGYLPAYALKLGRPIICTDYGGSRDYCSDVSGFPVSWSKREIRPGETILPVTDGWWAEVDQNALIVAMQAARTDRDEALRRTRGGKFLLDNHFSIEAQARRYRDRLLKLGWIEPIEA